MTESHIIQGETVMGVSQDFFNIFMQVSLEVFYVATGLIYAYWIKPFVKAKHTVITAAVI